MNADPEQIRQVREEMEQSPDTVEGNGYIEKLIEDIKDGSLLHNNGRRRSKEQVEKDLMLMLQYYGLGEDRAAGMLEKALTDFENRNDTDLKNMMRNLAVGQEPTARKKAEQKAKGKEKKDPKSKKEQPKESAKQAQESSPKQEKGNWEIPIRPTPENFDQFEFRKFLENPDGVLAITGFIEARKRDLKKAYNEKGHSRIGSVDDAIKALTDLEAQGKINRVSLFNRNANAVLRFCNEIQSGKLTDGAILGKYAEWMQLFESYEFLINAINNLEPASTKKEPETQEGEPEAQEGRPPQGTEYEIEKEGNVGTLKRKQQPQSPQENDEPPSEIVESPDQESPTPDTDTNAEEALHHGTPTAEQGQYPNRPKPIFGYTEEYNEAWQEWQAARTKSDTLQKQFNEEYDAYISSVEKRNLAEKLGYKTKQMFGFKPKLPEHLQELSDELREAKRRYHQGAKRVKDLKPVENSNFYTKEGKIARVNVERDQAQRARVMARYQQMLAKKLHLHPEERKIETQRREAEKAWESSRVSKFMEVMKKTRAGRVALTALGYGTVAALTSGTSTIWHAMAVGSGAATAYLARFGIGLGAGTVTGLGVHGALKTFYVGNKERKLSELTNKARRDHFEQSFEESEKAFSDAVQAVESSKARTKVAATAAAAAAGVGAGWGVDTESVENAGEDMVPETKQPMHPSEQQGTEVSPEEELEANGTTTSPQSTHETDRPQTFSEHDPERGTKYDKIQDRILPEEGLATDPNPPAATEQPTPSVENQIDEVGEKIKDRIPPERNTVLEPGPEHEFDEKIPRESEAQQPAPQERAVVEAPTPEGNVLNDAATPTGEQAETPAGEEHPRADISPVPEAYRVAQGDNLWNIMEGKGPDAHPQGGQSEVLKGMSQAERGRALNMLFEYMEQNEEFTKRVGVKSGNPQLIQPGSTVNIEMMDNKLRELLDLGEQTTKKTAAESVDVQNMTHHEQTEPGQRDVIVEKPDSPAAPEAESKVHDSSEADVSVQEHEVLPAEIEAAKNSIIQEVQGSEISNAENFDILGAYNASALKDLTVGEFSNRLERIVVDDPIQSNNEFYELREDLNMQPNALASWLQWFLAHTKDGLQPSDMDMTFDEFVTLVAREELTETPVDVDQQNPPTAPEAADPNPQTATEQPTPSVETQPAIEKARAGLISEIYGYDYIPGEYFFEVYIDMTIAQLESIGKDIYGDLYDKHSYPQVMEWIKQQDVPDKNITFGELINEKVLESLNMTPEAPETSLPPSPGDPTPDWAATENDETTVANVESSPAAGIEAPNETVETSLAGAAAAERESIVASVHPGRGGFLGVGGVSGAQAYEASTLKDMTLERFADIANQDAGYERVLASLNITPEEFSKWGEWLNNQQEIHRIRDMHMTLDEYVREVANNNVTNNPQLTQAA